jgi:hypothetical protein
MDDLFGVFPDGQDGPAAVFRYLEDAIAWGLERYGGDRFGIRRCPIELVSGAERSWLPAA